jgi:hypothetical protein
MQLGVISAVPLVAPLALATRRIRLAAHAALAGGTPTWSPSWSSRSCSGAAPQTLLDNVHIFHVPDRA